MTDKERDNRILNLESMLSEVLTLLKSGCFSAPSAPVIPCAYTLYSWLNEWYTTYKAPKLKKGSLQEIQICIERHIKPNFEDKPLNLVSGLDIQKAINQINSTLSRTKKYTHNVYNGAFKQAAKLGIISANPMESVETVKHEYNSGKALTREQQAHFYKVITSNKFCALYEFYLLSGCRREEAITLKWADIDFTEKRIHIRGTKTKTSNRIIPLFPAIEKLLDKLPRISETVFNTTVAAIHNNFKRVKARYNLQFRVHDLRHTFATRCLENGISIKTIQKWLGHSRLETTSSIYTHVQTAFEQEEIAKFNPYA